MRKNYNYTRQKLFLPEYGRHIQEMVDSLLEIEDRRERTRQAKAVIAVMGNLNPTLRDTPGFTHKLWDHLFIMSDFKLDVESPYPVPSRQELTIKPQLLAYPQSFIRFKHYGKYVAEIIRNISRMPDSAERRQAVQEIALAMRAKSFEYNQEYPSHDILAKDICRMSENAIDVDAESFNNLRNDYKELFMNRMQQNGRRPAKRFRQQTKKEGKKNNQPR